MKRIGFMPTLLLTLLTFSGCHRRPLSDGDDNVRINIDIDKDIINYTVTGDPSLMRVLFFDDRSGRYISQSFLPADGGAVNVPPGKTYDILVYNFDLETNVILSEYDRNRIMATTNDVPESYKTRLRSRAAKNEEERIAFEPEHMYVGRLEDVYIPARASDSPPFQISVSCRTVVQTWKVHIDKIQGARWIASIDGLITGLFGANSIFTARPSGENVSVFFETKRMDDDGRLEIVFNTFGYNPAISQDISLVITDIAGKGHIFNIDVSEQFIDNEDQIIRIRRDDLAIDKPEEPEGGGGLAPDVEEWDDVEQDIII